MTEQEWLCSASSVIMVQFLREKVSDRKFRLIACACCRRVWSLLRKASRRAVELGEELADGAASESSREKVARAAWEAVYNATGTEGAYENAAWMAHRCIVHDGWYAAEWTAGYNFEEEQEAPLVRCIFGNPFRPVALDAAWRKPEVLAMAQAMYEDRRFDDMPLLADALEEAGCTEEAILKHCREPGEHVRGCWVVDLILGKN